MFHKLSHRVFSTAFLVLASIGTCYAGAGGGCVGSGGTSVPEPASLGLLAVGVGAVLLYRWRKLK